MKSYAIGFAAILAIAISGALAGVGTQEGVNHPATGQATGQKDAPSANAGSLLSTAGLYTLDICPVSQNKLGSMGDPVVKKYDDKEVRFCCNGCVGKYEADTAKYDAVVAEKVKAQQLPHYPVTTCILMGDPLVDENGQASSFDVVQNNRAYRMCCKRCVRKLQRDAAAAAAKLDQAVAAAQRPTYPEDACLVSGEKLDSMGGPVEMVVANRLVRLCCKSCARKVKKNPATYIAKIDAKRGAKNLTK